MAVNDTFTTLTESMERGGAPGNNLQGSQRVANTFSTALAVAANDVIQAITFVDDTIVLDAWIKVNTKTTGAANASLGKADGAECMVATAIGAVGLKHNRTGKVAQLFAAGDTLDVHVSASAAGGNITVIALIVDAEDPDGS